jgi:hypothetical protein
VPIHVEEMLSELAVVDGDLPFTEAQLAKLVALVGRRLAEQQHAGGRDPRLPRRSIVPPLEVRG